MQRVHIEPKTRFDPRSVDALRDALRGREGAWLSAADATAASGVPLDEAERALLTLSTLHPCRVGVSPEGAILVRFEDLRVSRAPSPLRRAWDRALHHLARARDPTLATLTMLLMPLAAAVGVAGCVALVLATTSTPTLLAVVLFPLTAVGYIAAVTWTLVGTSALVVLSLAASGVLFIVGGALAAVDLVAGALDLGVLGALTIIALSAFGAWFSLRVAWGAWKEVSLGARAAWAPRLWRNVGGFLLGHAPRRRRDPLEDERRLTQLIAHRRGVVTAGDLIGLFGWTVEDAHSEIVRILLDYGGDVLVSDEGGLVYVFDDLAAATPPTDAPPAPVWEQPGAAAPRFFGCSPAFLGWTLAMLAPAALGALVGPGIAILPTPDAFFTASADLAVSADERTWYELSQGFGFWPHAALLALFALRAPLHLAAQARHRSWRRHLAHARAAAESPSGAHLADVDVALLALLDGDLRDGPLDPQRGHRVHFPSLALAAEAAARLRATRAPHQARAVLEVG